MSGAAGAAAGAAAAAAAIEARRRQEEEEGAHHLQFGPDWEFKIVRAALPAFRRPEALARFLAEESQAGWRLVEKFDNARVRLGRPVSARARDSTMRFDPYRTWWGISQWVVLTWVLVGTLGLLPLLAWLVFALAGGG